MGCDVSMKSTGEPIYQVWTGLCVLALAVLFHYPYELPEKVDLYAESKKNYGFNRKSFGALADVFCILVRPEFLPCL